MFKPSDAVVLALRQLHEALESAGKETAHLRRSLELELARRRPDITDPLLAAAWAAGQSNVEIGKVLVAACCRAGCARLGERHPGASIEVRVPPVAAVQIGFESGPRHTRGTPPNVVEMSPETFIGLATGLSSWEEDKAAVRSSGAHAHEAQQAFPVWKS